MAGGSRGQTLQVEAHRDGSSSDLAKSLVMLNRQDNGIAFIPDKRHCERVVEALNLLHAKTAVTPAVKEDENADGESTRECSWESMRTLDGRCEEASTHDALDADKTSLNRSAVARLTYWAVDRPDIQNAVRVCSKSMSSPRVRDWQRLKGVARYAKGCPDTGIIFEWQTASNRLMLQSDSDSAGDKRKSVSAGNIRYGQHLLRTWSKDQTVTAMSSGEEELYAACVIGTENVARELGMHLDTMGLQGGRQCGTWSDRQAGSGKIETSGPELLVAAVSRAWKTGQRGENTVRERHGKSWDESAREGQN